MKNSFGRFWAFTLTGVLALTLWAALFGALSGILAYGMVLRISPDSHNSFASIVFMAATTLASIVCPLSFLICGGAWLLTSTPRIELWPLLVGCAMRSLQGAVLLGMVGALIAGVQGFTSTPGETDVMPSYLYGLIAGWSGGFLLGLIWAGVEGVIRLRKGRRNLDLELGTPPLARP